MRRTTSPGAGRRDALARRPGIGPAARLARTPDAPLARTLAWKPSFAAADGTPLRAGERDPRGRAGANALADTASCASIRREARALALIWDVRYSRAA